MPRGGGWADVYAAMDLLLMACEGGLEGFKVPGIKHV